MTSTIFIASRLRHSAQCLAHIIGTICRGEQHGGRCYLIHRSETANGKLCEFSAAHSSVSLSSSGVSIGPGAMALTRTPRNATSRASGLVSPITPALLAA